MAYWMLTGQLVFEAKRPLEMAMKHVREEPVPPSRRSELEIPDKLEEAVLSCLAKDSGQQATNLPELRSNAFGLRGAGTLDSRARRAMVGAAPAFGDPQGRRNIDRLSPAVTLVPCPHPKNSIQPGDLASR